MTQKDLIKIMKAVVRSELQAFKSEILLELKLSSPQKPNSMVLNEEERVQRNFRSQYQSAPKQKPKFSNPLLSILNETKPLSGNELYDDPSSGPGEGAKIYDNPALAKIVDQGFNVPTTQGGQPLNAPKGVLDAMNRDYSSMFKPKGKLDEIARQSLISRIQGEDVEEDLSWLNEIG